MIQCFIQNGPPLSQFASEALYQTACRMIRLDKSKQTVYHDDCMGTVTTKWQTAILGGSAGFVFVAQIKDENGHHEVHYLVNADEEKMGEEGDWYKLIFRPRRQKAEEKE
jgi:hypothetical protein